MARRRKVEPVASDGEGIFFVGRVDDAHANTVLEVFDAGVGGHSALVSFMTADGRTILADPWVWHGDEGTLVVAGVMVSARVHTLAGRGDDEFVVEVGEPPVASTEPSDDEPVVVGEVPDLPPAVEVDDPQVGQPATVMETAPVDADPGPDDTFERADPAAAAAHALAGVVPAADEPF